MVKTPAYLPPFSNLLVEWEQPKKGLYSNGSPSMVKLSMKSNPCTESSNKPLRWTLRRKLHRPSAMGLYGGWQSSLVPVTLRKVGEADGSKIGLLCGTAGVGANPASMVTDKAATLERETSV